MIYKKFGKRIFDIIFFVLTFPVVFPLILLISLILLIKQGRPIFFLQERVGKNFKPFKLIKFRTMIKDADKVGPSITGKNDSRITPMGRFLRKTKLDELPQFLNVLKGDMSVVGPRPEVPKYVELFRKDYEEILSIRPGIVDYATLIYTREEEVLSSGEDREKTYIEEILTHKIKLYKKYLSKMSLRTDMEIILKTIELIIINKNSKEKFI